MKHGPHPTPRRGIEATASVPNPVPGSESGTYAGEVQNGGGSRYGGTVMPYIPYDPGYMTLKSTSDGTLNAPTTPFQI